MESVFLRENVNTILDHLVEGINIVDEKGNIVYYNKFAARMEGISRNKVLGKYLLEVYPSLTETSSTLLTVLRTGKAIYDREQTFTSYKGEKITTINTTLPIKVDEKVVGAMEISRDITVVKQMSEEIHDLQTRLNPPGERKVFKGEVDYDFSDIIGKSPRMLEIKDLALRASKTDVSVMIGGDTGTGKELFVQSIHNNSERREEAFIAQNCAALPANLLESILFGTKKGGFTGAEDRPGLFELADGGTLFLDEINSMPLELQSKLLRVLQDRRIRRVGDTETIDVDVRLISAINTTTEEVLESKKIRRDLFYRLNVVSINLPKLKDRKEDIPLLVDHFIRKYNQRFNKEVIKISEEVNQLFLDYRWDGNVRELEHLLEGTMSMMDDKSVIELEDLPLKFQRMEIKELENLDDLVENYEREIIYENLVKTDWNISRTAEALKIPRQTLQYRINKYNLKKRRPILGNN